MSVSIVDEHGCSIKVVPEQKEVGFMDEEMMSSLKMITQIVNIDECRTISGKNMI